MRRASAREPLVPRAASPATQVGAARGVAAFTAIALSAVNGFTAAFTAAAVVALATALLGCATARR